ncbi:hypothetical protein TSMG0085 [Halocynthia phage JM-2012]|uniref:hypothetical protein n=1 Tax=Halocynthia phage JM-2012 TaxID=1173297 RepID=UPI00025C6929|nr:hypothetical protein TSMG0085 [Halocynthia phage JM-2012]AFI55368.1 hypothetical protein TSMG0085 [Halocynthia phage JM-2012]
MRLYTCQIAKWRKAENFLDTTVKSGDKLFAPTWNLLGLYRTGQINDEEYKTQFIELMRTSFTNNKDHWLKILNQEVLTIGCYCTPGKFCHRLILVELFKSVCLKYNINFEYLGELE